VKTLTVFGTFLAVALCLFAAANRLTNNDFTVHEWGTFTSVAAADGKAADWDTLGCKDDLPGFVNDFGYRGFKFRLGGTVRMETPVIYFYSASELSARVKVSFPNGLLTEWYPKADHQILGRNYRTDEVSMLPLNLNGFNTSLSNQTGSLEWQSVRVQPGTSPGLPAESAPSRYYAARRTDSAPLLVGSEHEKFLFYRGVARATVPISATAGQRSEIVIWNMAAVEVPAVFLFENRGGSIGYRNVGGLSTHVTVERPVLDASVPQLKTDLERAMISNGLYAKEAAAMIDTWQDSWFEEGSRLIYILPESTVDAMLPLEIDPVPARVKRVFVGRMELITPETKRIVREAVARNDRHTLALYQRFLDPIAKSIGAVVNVPCQTVR
jgi:hypothetical protein